MSPLESTGAPRPGDREEVRPGIALDTAQINHRLITIRRSITYLTGMLPVTVESLEDHEATGLVVERTFALMVDLAFAINSHVVAAVSGCVPRDYLRSIAAAAEVGLVEPTLAQAMRAANCAPHVLVQLCMDSEPGRVEAVVADALDQFRQYAEQVADWASFRAAGMEPTQTDRREEMACAR